MKLKRVAKPLNKSWIVNNSKYNNIKTTRTINWIEVEFDSLIEAKFRDMCSVDIKNLGIKNIKLQETFVLQEWYSWQFIWVKKELLKVKVWNQKRSYTIEDKTKKVQPIKYICDFILEMIDWTEYIIDVKWIETPDFKIKKKMFEKTIWKSLICVNSVLINSGWFVKWLKDKHNPIINK